jgi:hypothetical protein
VETSDPQRPQQLIGSRMLSMCNSLLLVEADPC